jgi:hypothetical protein
MLKNYIKLIVVLVFATNVMAQNIPSYVPKDGLVGWWPFNGNANDESGNKINGTINGVKLTEDRFGKMNSAYNFDGINNFIKINTIPKLDNKDGLTISAYILPLGTTGSRQFIVSRGYDYASGSFFLCHESNQNSDKLRFSINGYGTSNVLTTNSYKIPYSNWQHIVAVKDNNSIKLFVNGVLTNTSSYANQLLTNTDTVYFGVHHFENQTSGWFPYYFKGKMDDVAIYNRALSEQEIKQLYEGCPKEIATSTNFNAPIYTTSPKIILSAQPTGGTFSGIGVVNNVFNPSETKLGKNTIKYTFKNTKGCTDSTNFYTIVSDTINNKCTSYDTLKIKVKLTTGIKTGQLTSMNIYPNPTSDILIIEANDIQALGGYKYKILDLQGKEVYNALATSAKTEISLKSIGAKGMYILHIVDEKGVSIENKKIVLE